MDLELRLQHDIVAVQTATELHLMVELTAPPQTHDDSRQPLRVAVVLDKSGSMGGERLPLAKRAARYLVEQMTDDDQMAVVAYDDTVDLVAPLAPVDKQALAARIDAIDTGGMTNLSGGWLKGVEELRRVDDGIRRVLLLSDGHANQGITDPSQLAGMAGTIAAEGISLSTIGIGDGFDEHLMTGLSDAGRGRGHFAATPDDAPGIFAEEFEDLVSLAAQNLSVEIRPTDDVEVVGVLNEYPSTPIPGGVQVVVGDAFAGQTLRVVLTLGIPALPALGLATVGEVVVRWVSVGDEIAEHKVSSPLVVNAVSADEVAAATPDAAVTEEVTVLLAGKAAEEARRLAEGGDVDKAREVMEKAIDDLNRVVDDHPAAARLRQTVDRMTQTTVAMAAAPFSAEMAKDLHYSSRNLRNRKRND